jgi:hypothetical protein
MAITEDHLREAKALLLEGKADEALKVLAFAALPIADSEELRDVVYAKLSHIAKQQPYVKAGKPLLKALDEVSEYLTTYHKSAKKPLFTVSDREAFIKALKQSDQWEQFDVKKAIAFVTRKQAKETATGRQDLVLVIVLDKSKPVAKIYLAHLEALDGKTLTFGYNFFYEMPERHEQQEHPFSWKVGIEESGLFQNYAFITATTDLVADHATSDFKGDAQALVGFLDGYFRSESKRIFKENAKWFEGMTFGDFLKEKMHVEITFLSQDWDRLHPKDKRAIKDGLEKNSKMHVEVTVL